MNFDAEVQQAFQEHERTSASDAGSVCGYADGDDVFVEVTYGGRTFTMEKVIPCVTALADHFTDEFDGSVSIALYKDRLCRITVDGGNEDMDTDELRQRVLSGLRID